MFADDSNLFSSGKDINQLTNKINQEIPLLVNWLRANRLSLNIAKTHVMLFGPRKKIPIEDINIQIEGKKLDIVTTTKFLGVILDSNISWKDHIAHISKKVARSVGILSIAKKNSQQKINDTTLLFIYLPVFNILYSHLGQLGSHHTVASL